AAPRSLCHDPRLVGGLRGHGHHSIQPPAAGGGGFCRLCRAGHQGLQVRGWRPPGHCRPPHDGPAAHPGDPGHPHPCAPCPGEPGRQPPGGCHPALHLAGLPHPGQQAGERGGTVSRGAALALAAVVLLAGVLGASRFMAALDRDPLPELYTLGGDFALPSTNGGDFGSADTRGRLVLLNFGFTACPDVCPTASAGWPQCGTAAPWARRSCNWCSSPSTRPGTPRDSCGTTWATLATTWWAWRAARTRCGRWPTCTRCITTRMTWGRGTTASPTAP